MRIPPYWAKGTHAGTDKQGKKHEYRAWGWSFKSIAEASAEAGARASRIFEAIMSGRTPDSYDYLERPLREEIVDSIGPEGDETVIITRNRYGALILNCRSVCFADVDFPRVKSSGIFDSVLMAFSSKLRQTRIGRVQQDTIDRVREWSSSHPQHSFRLYRTAAGLRLLFTDRLYDPVSDDVSAILEGLGSDVLYRKLTLKQECFRARLTPKPWRCGCRRPPNRYPWGNADAERTYRAWQQEYEAKSTECGTCRFLDTLGNDHIDESIAEIVKLHDDFTGCARNAKLA